MLRAMKARSSLIAIGSILCALASLGFTQLARAQAAPVEAAPAHEAPVAPAPAPPSDPALAPAPAEAPPLDEPPAPPPAAPSAPPPEPYAIDPQYDGQVGADGRAHYGGQEDPTYEDPEYVEPEDDSDNRGGDDFEVPPFSIRLDPFNWLIEGRLGFELEVGVLDFMTIEIVPVLVANSEPPSFNLSGRDDAISQASNGIGPIAGASIGVGFWPGGEPLRGYVIRVVLTNYGFTYNASDRLGIFDKVDFTERRLMAYFGSHTRFGFFTIAGGIGLGYELNQQQRCYLGENTASRSGCSDDGEMHIALEDPGMSNGNPAVADLNGPLHPVYLEGRLSIGVAFD